MKIWNLYDELNNAKSKCMSMIQSSFRDEVFYTFDIKFGDKVTAQNIFIALTVIGFIVFTRLTLRK